MWIRKRLPALLGSSACMHMRVRAPRTSAFWMNLLGNTSSKVVCTDVDARNLVFSIWHAPTEQFSSCARAHLRSQAQTSHSVLICSLPSGPSVFSEMQTRERSDRLQCHSSWICRHKTHGNRDWVQDAVATAACNRDVLFCAFK